MNIKTIFMTVTGVLGSLISGLFGGWSTAMNTLLIFMAIDFLTGLTVAGVFHKSKKTNQGGLESRAGFKGLVRKGMILLIVLIGSQLDLVMGTNHIRDAVVIAFIVNETISILENAGLMGIPMPDILVKSVEVLKAKGDKKDESMY